LLASALLASLFVASCQLVLGDFSVVSQTSESGLASNCLPNSFRCDGSTLEACRPDRTGFDPVEECVEPEVCDPTAGTCRVCVPNEHACNGAELIRCGPDGRWQAGTTCASEALCTLGYQRMTGVCSPAACAAGTLICQGARLMRCNESLDGYSLVEDCGDVTSCDAEFARMADETGAPHCAAATCGDACGAPACSTPGTVRCVSDFVSRLEVCGTDRQFHEIEVCAHPALCSEEEGRCLPPACALGERRCVGQELEECASDRTAFTHVETCAEGTTCTPQGCDPTPCAETSVRCNHAAFERCVGGVFVAENRCVSPELCEPEEGCVDPVCGGHLERFQCSTNGLIVRICKPGRDDFEEFITCEGDERCNAETGTCQIP
jgi:hypothetical protein